MNFQKLQLLSQSFVLRSLGLIVSVAAASSLFSVPALCATYYVDSQSGNDEFDGLTTVSAWKSLSRVSSTELLPGDSVLLRRGSLWREQLTLKYSGSASSVIRIGSYDQGSRPVISGADLAGTWTMFSGTIYSTPVASAPANVYVYDTTLLKARNSLSEVSQLGSWFYETSSGRLYVSLSDGSSPVNHTVESAVRWYGICASGISYITVEGVEIRHVRASGIFVDRVSQYWTVSDSFIHNVTEAGVYVKSTDSVSLRGWVIKNNIIGAVDSAPVLDYDRAGILVRGTTGATIQGNHVDALNKFGIRVSNNSQGSPSYGAVVADNSLGMNQGNISIAYTDAAVVTRNTIMDSKGYGIGIGKSNDVEVSYNTIQNLKISDDKKLYNGIDVNAGSLRGNLHHNTVVAVAIFSVTLEDVNSEPSNDWVVRYNIFDARINLNDLSAVEGDVVGTLMVCPMVTRYTFASNNYVPHPNYPNSVVRYHDTDYAFSGWTSIANDTGSVSADPMFVNVAAGDLRLQSSSPCTLRRGGTSGVNAARECGRYPF